MEQSVKHLLKYIIQTQSVIGKVSTWSSTLMSPLHILWQTTVYPNLTLWIIPLTFLHALECPRSNMGSAEVFCCKEEGQRSLSHRQHTHTRTHSNTQLLLLYCQEWQCESLCDSLWKMHVPFMFSDWMGSLADSIHKIFHTNTATNQLMQTHSSLLFFPKSFFLYLKCFLNLCNLYLSSLPPVLFITAPNAAEMKSFLTACHTGLLSSCPHPPPHNRDRMYSVSHDGDTVEGEGGSGCWLTVPTGTEICPAKQC